jgi:hypothetical protein
MRSTPALVVSLLLVLSGSLLACAVAAPDPTELAPAATAPSEPEDPVLAAAPDRPLGAVSGAKHGGDPAIPPTSSVYPAPHPGMPSIPRNGGKVLHDPSIVTVTFAGDPYQKSLQAFGEQIGNLHWWTTVHDGYGVGPARSGGNVVIPTTPPAQISDGEVETWLAARVADGTLPAATDQRIYMLYYPQATTVTIDPARGGGASCRVFLGYHTTISVTAGGQTVPIAYAVVNRCGGGLDEITGTASHELTEASTDPHPVDDASAGYVTLDDTAWTGLGGENADMCCSVSPATEAGWTLTRVWNNRTAATGQQPCVPVPDASLPYFNAGLVHERLTASPGGSAQTEVDCYAFGPLPAPMTLTADIQSPLAISFDRRTCTNGDKVTLTVSVGAGAQRGADYRYTLLSSVDAAPAGTHLWRGLVHVQ